MTIASFLSYLEKTREATNRIINVIPQDKMNWSYKPGKFTIADIVGHLGAIERYVFAEIVSGKPSCYKGCGKDIVDGYDNVIGFFHEMHYQSMAIFSSLTDHDLNRKITTLSGSQTSIASFLRALITHEIHHCGALCIYLNLLNVKTPSIFGLTEEEVQQRANSLSDN